MRRPDTALLHGPWPDTTPDPDTRALTKLAEDHAGTWIIWRAMSSQKNAGNWCARRAGHGTPTGVSATSSDELRHRIAEADR